MSDPGDGHPEVRTWKECVMDFGDVTDDGEVQLNQPRRGYGAEPTWRGHTGYTGGHCFGSVSAKSGGTVSVGSPQMVIEEPSSPGAGATVGTDDFERNGSETGVPGPVLPPFRQDQQGATRMDADRRGGPQGPEGRMLIQTVKTCWWIRKPACSGIYMT